MINRQHPALLSAVAAGQIDFSIMGETNWLEVIRTGAPLGLIYPEEGVALNYWIYAILANAPSPNAARYFIDWITTFEGQTAVVKATNPLYALLEGVDSPEGLGDMSKLKALPMDLDEYLLLQERITNEAAAALGLGAD